MIRCLLSSPPVDCHQLPDGGGCLFGRAASVNGMLHPMTGWAQGDEALETLNAIAGFGYDVAPPLVTLNRVVRSHPAAHRADTTRLLCGPLPACTPLGVRQSGSQVG